MLKGSLVLIVFVNVLMSSVSTSMASSSTGCGC
jgi:hypothetical protein